MKSTSDLFNEMIPLGRLIQMVNQKKDRLLNDYLSPMDITATQFRVLCSIRCEVCITPVELKTVLSVDPGAMTRMLDRLGLRHSSSRPSLSPPKARLRSGSTCPTYYRSGWHRASSSPTSTSRRWCRWTASRGRPWRSSARSSRSSAPPSTAPSTGRPLPLAPASSRPKPRAFLLIVVRAGVRSGTSIAPPDRRAR